MTPSERLKRIIAATGWTQTQLAARLGVSFATVNSWLNQRSLPRVGAQANIDTLYLEIIGVDSVPAQVLTEVKQRAMSTRLSLKSLLAERQRLDRFVVHVTYHTNAVEGSTMTLADTDAVLFGDQVLPNRTQVEQAEARNHQAALLWLLQQVRANGFTITVSLVCDLHVRLMNGILADAGVVRRHPVRIAGMGVPLANPVKIARLLDECVDSINDPQADVVAWLAHTHATFEQIHPFADGNGRIGRLLLLAQSLRAGIAPVLVRKEKKFAYYKALQRAQTAQDNGPLEALLAQAILDAHNLLTQ